MPFRRSIPTRIAWVWLCLMVGGAASAAESGTGASAAHWSFLPVARPAVPPVEGRAGLPAGPIDRFVVQRLQQAGLDLGPEADRATLIRRLYLVMLGVPPSPQEVESFLQDDRPEAYEHLVDRVLDDPRYGERWGRHWLDVIRFAESNGFETNRERTNAWRFRDYVIAAFNDDKPYDRFIREQIAGDALGVDVATGFLVGGPVDIVKSPDVELTAQQRANELDDMVSTTGTAFLGLTVGCARCHAHKFDPISQAEYYSLTAVFAGVNHGDRPLPSPPHQQRELRRLDELIGLRERQLGRFIPRAQTSVPGQPRRPAVNAVRNEEAFAPVESRRIRFTIQATSGGEPCLDELEVWSGDRNVALAELGTRATASGTLPGYEIHQLKHLNDGKVGNRRSWISDENGKGWVELEFARTERIERIVWGRDREGAYGDRIATAYRIESAVSDGGWILLASSEDREPFAGGSTPAPEPTYRFDGFPADEAAEGRRWLAELETARKERARRATTPLVYAGTFSEPEPTHRLNRGDPMQRLEVVAPGGLALFNPFSTAADAPEQQRRVRLAEWVASPQNPLTARVMVNRIWQHHFGTGLVDTPNDFGRNGSRPTHPELLDWLAAELVAGGWSIKHLQRQILLSATWRQSSAPRPEGLAADAASRLLWRFPPRRLEAEAIRDSILAVSGNLDPTAGGPSFHLHDVDRENVYHYHPKEEFGPGESRRMVYAFKVRMEQDGIFGAFDCPDGSLVTPKRSISTTPLQALNLFNSPFMVRQAEYFAERLRQEAGPSEPARIERAWWLAFGRAPASDEEETALALVRAEKFPALCRALLNANEFLFVP